jgi:Flp pilus assembly protein TadD
MTRPSTFGSAISLIAMSTMIAGCATPQTSAIREVKPVGEVGLATRAMAALNSGQVPMAIDFAERAVANTPNDVGFRALLGNAYFAGGRFASAEGAYKDSLSLYPNQPQVVLKLALVEIAQGKTVEAVNLLAAAGDLINPADSGLALALAARPKDAIQVLESAARQPGADARVRQNLALAYALSGDWTEARTIAAQDVPANQLDTRIQQWMQFASPKKASDQVAAMLGVTPAVVDPGQPVRLALRKADTRMAQAAPAPAAAPQPQVVAQPRVAAPQPQVAMAAPVPVPPAPVAVTPPVPAPQPMLAEVSLPSVAAAPRLQPIAVPATPVPQFAEAVAAPPAPPPAPKPAPAAAESPAPVTMALMAAATKARDAVETWFAPKPLPAAKPAKAVKARPRVIPAAAPRALRGNSGAVVQIGAYSSPQRVSQGWATLTARYPALRSYLPMRAKVVLPKGTFYRLSITGFASQREAIARCKVLKTRGGACFVRNFAGDAPVEYASR